jgi:hypothetical protein
MSTGRRLLLGLLLGSAASCATLSSPPAGTLRIRCNVPDATVWIDDIYGGRAEAWARGRLVRAGFHRVELRHPDHYNHYAEVDVAEGGVAEVRAEMRRHLE